MLKLCFALLSWRIEQTSSFVSSLEKTATGTHKMLKTVYRKEAVSCRLVFEWFKSERYMRSGHEVLKRGT